MHLVGWDKISQPRRYGGLGVRVARLQNVSLLGKLIWEVLNTPEKLWVRLITEKYLKGRSIFNVAVTGGSATWNSINKTLHMLKDGFSVKIGNGYSKFWFDSWVFKEKLSSMVPFVAIQDTDMRINDVWQNGRWNLEKLYTIIPDFVRDAILSLRPYIVDDIPDTWVWHNSSTGVYTTKDAYEWLLQPAPINNQPNWRWIWKLKVPSNIQFFVWQVIHGAIPTRKLLNHRKVCASNLCPRCTTLPESIEHCLFACAESVDIWRGCGLDFLLPTTTDVDLFQWCRQVNMSHGSIIFIVMWVIWCSRNDFIFNNNKVMVHVSVAKVLALTSCCSAAFETNSLGSNQAVDQQLVSWSCPHEGTICLNVDGSMLGSLQTAGFGGLIRNNFGAFLKGFYGTASHPSVLYAEIIAILHGLELCWDNGFRNVTCYSDSLQAVTLIKTGVSHHHQFANEIQRVRQLLSKDWNTVINHTFREGNACADLLTKICESASGYFGESTSPTF
jgi:ribonuclease HI